MNSLLTLVLLLSFQSFAQEQRRAGPAIIQKNDKKPVAAVVGGGGNGGESIIVNGKRVLRDTVDPTNCDWMTGEALWASNPLFEKVVDRLSQFNWYFAFDIERRVKKSDYCFTQNLVRVVTDDIHGVNKPSKIEYDQSGIVLDDIYVDRVHYSEMSKKHQALFIMHENVHSYIPDNEPFLNNKVRSAANLISKVYSGVIKSREEFHYQLRKNIGHLPFSDNLVEYQEQIKFILSSNEDRDDHILTQTKLDKFFSELPQVPVIKTGELYQSDVIAVNNFNGLNTFEYIKKICEKKKDDLVNSIIENGSVSDTSLFFLCAEQILDEDEIITESIKLMKQPAKDLLNKLSLKDVYREEMRIYANENLKIASSQSSLSIKSRVLELEPIDVNDMHYQLYSLWVYLAKLINLHDQSTIAEIFLNNNALKQALAFAQIQKKVSIFSVMKKETENVNDLLERMKKNMTLEMLEYLKKETSKSYVELIKLLKL